MNNEAFKQYIKSHVDAVIEDLGGIDRVRELSSHAPDCIFHFVAGGVFGRLAGGSPSKAKLWREEGGDPRSLFFLNQEEIRRTLDVVRLRLETGSATS